MQTVDAKHPWHPQVLHMGVDVSGSFMSYWPGDSLGVRPRNDPALVDALLKRLDADGTAVFSVAPADDDEDGEVGNEGGEGTAPVKRLLPHLNWPCTLSEAFTVRNLAVMRLHAASVVVNVTRIAFCLRGPQHLTWCSHDMRHQHMYPDVRTKPSPGSMLCSVSLPPGLGCKQASKPQAGCDLTSVPRKSLLRLLAEHCGDAGDKRALLHLSSRDGRADYAAQIVREQPSLLDLLHRSRCCRSSN